MVREGLIRSLETSPKYCLPSSWAERENFTAKLPCHVKPHAEHSPGPTSSSTPPHHKKKCIPTDLFFLLPLLVLDVHSIEIIPLHSTVYNLEVSFFVPRPTWRWRVWFTLKTSEVRDEHHAASYQKTNWRSRMCSTELGDHHRMVATQLERSEWPIVSRHQPTIHILAQPTVNEKQNLTKTKKVNINRMT